MVEALGIEAGATKGMGVRDCKFTEPGTSDNSPLVREDSMQSTRLVTLLTRTLRELRVI